MNREKDIGLAATRDSYRTDDGSFVGSTLEEAAAWAKGHPITWSETTIWWHRDDDAEATDVDRDIRDIIAARQEDAKTPDQVNAEALAILNRKLDRLMFEMSGTIEILTARIKRLEERDA